MQTKNLINLKNIVVAVITIVVIYLMVLTASRGGAYHGGEQGKVIEDISKVQMPTQQDTQQYSQQQQQTQPKEEVRDELKELKEKAGSIGQINVSLAYKSKCSACHGIDGSGMQDGRKLIGPKLYGQDAEKIYKDLIDFKAGKKENVIMSGLLINTSEEELRKFADEIGAFSSQEKNQK
ncbi:MAG: hypothetical protein A2513_07985 [Sulfurimonas sp. RIFOXYD12_FULL_33_39]|uniref:c-type cytochrome n=1 Tax=unclassified Sulfurimonas TaxID=2623549 RepID=UPI0008D0ED40|nr:MULTISPECIES: c-type cytochrome [unclassified Sulfurimonas]OHE10029.1 MAG: hypothetical protein A2513_07985 [Sulfurimonas sp. RIFOXYD12_FULL_33_39]OHE14750.1 MAG: hypothetical protein A2530_02495 [Sulfurimonas sp. RIFOXYD2_FULL_34_21]